jgi:hypothetical protein
MAKCPAPSMPNPSEPGKILKQREAWVLTMGGTLQAA